MSYLLEIPNRLTLNHTLLTLTKESVALTASCSLSSLHGRRQKGKEKPRVGIWFFPFAGYSPIRHHQTWRSTAGSYPRQDNHRRIQIVVTGWGTRCSRSVHNNEVTVKDWMTRLWKTHRRNNGPVVWLGFLCILIIFYLGAANCIISTAQHARPNCIGHIEPYKYETKRIQG